MAEKAILESVLSTVERLAENAEIAVATRSRVPIRVKDLARAVLNRTEVVDATIHTVASNLDWSPALLPASRVLSHFARNPHTKALPLIELLPATSIRLLNLEKLPLLLAHLRMLR
jgi:hypothetical protein